MAQVGYMGDIVFVASEAELRTPANISRSGGARWEEHKLHLMKPASEFAGPDLEQLSFKMHFSKANGVDPLEEIDTLRSMRDNGEVFPLVLAGSPITENYWRIESISDADNFYDGKGNLIRSAVTVSLKEYDNTGEGG